MLTIAKEITQDVNSQYTSSIEPVHITIRLAAATRGAELRDLVCSHDLDSTAKILPEDVSGFCAKRSKWSKLISKR